MVGEYRPGNLIEALYILSEKECTILAGGTDLMVQRARGFAIKPGFDLPILFIEHLPELKQIYRDNNEIHIGACAILSDMMLNEIIPEPLKEMIGRMASPPTRNMATIGGNLCNASPAADTLPYLYAVNAKVILQNFNNTRTVTIQKFITGPKTTLLQKNEILTEIIIPDKKFDINIYRRLGQRKGMSLTKVSFLGLADISENRIHDIRIALGSVAPTIVRSFEIERKMINKNLDEIKQISYEISDQYDKLIKPIDDARSTAKYRKEVSLNLIKHFLENLA